MQDYYLYVYIPDSSSDEIGKEDYWHSANVPSTVCREAKADCTGTKREGHMVLGVVGYLKKNFYYFCGKIVHRITRHLQRHSFQYSGSFTGDRRVP